MYKKLQELQETLQKYVASNSPENPRTRKNLTKKNTPKRCQKISNFILEFLNNSDKKRLYNLIESIFQSFLILLD